MSVFLSGAENAGYFTLVEDEVEDLDCFSNCKNRNSVVASR